MFSKNLCVLVLWMKVASALEGLTQEILLIVVWIYDTFDYCYFLLRNSELSYEILEGRVVGILLVF